MNDSGSDQKFSVSKRAKSFTHACRGLWIFLKTAHNAWIQLVILILVIILGIHFNVTRIEWLALIFAAGLVLVSEAFNSAIEIDINLTSSEYHPYARDTKDVAAGAVLVASIVAVMIGVIVFWPYVI